MNKILIIILLLSFVGCASDMTTYQQVNEKVLTDGTGHFWKVKHHIGDRYYFERINIQDIDNLQRTLKAMGKMQIISSGNLTSN